ncbi:hypothetical protein HK100_003368 [Physocladia obscura]|uniref:Uncharacterized protein n=1 Tax=Physocladia obscura TaxID=109957 RepID=A0AAD5SUE5_9FUNG|nr:hypothetical protein HK100_003368 [Physocladia obscura]
MVAGVELWDKKDNDGGNTVRKNADNKHMQSQSREVWEDQYNTSSTNDSLDSLTIIFVRDDSPSSSSLTPLQVGLIAAASAIAAVFAAVYITARLHRWKSKFAKLMRRKQQQQETATTVEALFGVTPETNILAERLKQQQQQSTLLRQQQQQWRQSTTSTALPDEFLVSTTSLYAVDRPTPATIKSINRVSRTASFSAVSTVAASVSDELSAIAASVFDPNNPTEYNAQIMAEIQASSIINGGGGSPVYGIIIGSSTPVTPSPMLPSYAIPTSRSDRRMSRLSSASGVSSPAATALLSPEDLVFAKKFNRYSRAYSDAGWSPVVGSASGSGAVIAAATVAPRAGSRAESYWDKNSNSNSGRDESGGGGSGSTTGSGSAPYNLSTPNLARSALGAVVQLSPAGTTSSPADSINNNDNDGSGGGGGGESSEQEQKSADVSNGVAENAGRRRSSSSLKPTTTTAAVVVKKKSRSANSSAHVSPRISTAAVTATTFLQYNNDMLFEYTHEWMQYFDLNPDAADEGADRTEKWKVFYVEFTGARKMAEVWRGRQSQMQRHSVTGVGLGLREENL